MKENKLCAGMQEEARTLGFSAVLARESESKNSPEGLPADSLTYRSTFFKGETGMAGGSEPLSAASVQGRDVRARTTWVWGLKRRLQRDRGEIP